ncbi:MAG: dTMP kinase [Patescibacteria group bacterium]
MIKHELPGLFIAFEGLDGSGSSTQVDLLVKALNNLGYFAFGTKEPTNNLIGGLIRGALTHDWKASPECLQLLFAADRAHHLQREVIPNLEKGNIVITDRYLFSTIAYGSIDMPRNWLLKLNERFILPDITFYIRLTPRECLRRIGKSRHQFELFEEMEKLKKVKSMYLTMSRRKNLNIMPINGFQTIDQIAEEILLITGKMLENRKGLHYRERDLFSQKKDRVVNHRPK